MSFICCYGNQLASLEHCSKSVTNYFVLIIIKPYIPENPSLQEITINAIIKNNLDLNEYLGIYRNAIVGMKLCLKCKKGVYKAKRKRYIVTIHDIDIPNFVCVNC